MDDSGRETSGTRGASPEAGAAGTAGRVTPTDGTVTPADGTGAAADRAGRPGLGRFARPALAAGLVFAVVCGALLVIIFFLDSFNATVYSVGGKNVQDATDEARSIRDSYAAARTGGTVFLLAGLALAAAGGFLLYRDRNAPGRNDAGDDGEDVDFEDLGGR